MMKWNSDCDAASEEMEFNPLVQVKLEPKSVGDYGCEFSERFHDYYPSSSDTRQSSSVDGIDLMDIKLEELCSSYFPADNEKGFTFVEPRACEDAGYDTCTTLGSDSCANLDQDWIDSPSSVESFVSSCSELVESYQKSNEASLTLEPPELPPSAPTCTVDCVADCGVDCASEQPVQESIPQIAITSIHSHTPRTVNIFSAAKDSTCQYVATSTKTVNFPRQTVLRCNPANDDHRRHTKTSRVSKPLASVSPTDACAVKGATAATAVIAATAALTVTAVPEAISDDCSSHLSSHTSR